MGELAAGTETGGAAALEVAAEAALERGEKIAPCRNCAAPVLGTYCGACGQPVDTHRRSVFHLLHDLLKDIVSFDSRILRTLHALFLQPGELALAFREGRTQRYMPPIRLYLFTSLIFFLTLSVADIAILQLQFTTATKRYVTNASGNVLEVKNGETEILPGLKADKSGLIVANPRGEGPPSSLVGTKADGHPIPDFDVVPLLFAPKRKAAPVPPVELEKILQGEGLNSAKPGAHKLEIFGRKRDPKHMLETLATNPAAINGPLTEWITRILFVLLPVYALVLAVLYWRQRADFYFVDHLVFSLNAFSFIFALSLMAIVAAQFVASGTVAWLALVTVWIYFLLAMKRFYRQSWGWTAAKFVLTSLIFGVFALGPALTGVFAVALLNL